MKNLRIGTVGILALALVLQGCSLAWVGTLDTVLAAAAPALNNVIAIVDLAQNKPVNTTLQAKITADAANLKTLATAFANASGTNPTSCQEVQAAVNVLNDDSAVVLQLVQASGSSNIAAIFSAADAFVTVIVGLIPACKTPAQVSASRAKAAAVASTVDANKLIANYNAVLTKPTGDPKVDAFTKANQVHVHSKFVRVVTFGKKQ